MKQVGILFPLPLHPHPWTDGFTSHLQKRVSKQLLQQPTRLAQKAIEAFKQTTETMNLNPKNNRASSYTDLMKLELVNSCVVSAKNV